MSKPRRHRDREAIAAAVIGAAFLVLGIWIATRPGGLADGGIVVVFSASVLVVGLARLGAVQDELRRWPVLLGCAGLIATCLILLAASFRQPGPWSLDDIVMLVTCVVGVALFGVGGIGYAIRTLKHRRDHQDR